MEVDADAGVGVGVGAVVSDEGCGGVGASVVAGVGEALAHVETGSYRSPPAG